VVGVNLQDTPEGRDAVIRESGLTYPQVPDPGGSLAQAYGVRALPTVVLLDRGGVVRHVGHGLPERALLDRVLAEGPP
jgi:peroxiredoxin